MSIIQQATPQQQAAINQSVEKGQIALLNAYAGTGKTTTLEMIARARPDLRFLYLCFNRDNANEARKRFPNNCECSTIHSMAWHAMGRSYETGDLRPRTVMDAFNLSVPFVAVYVIDTLNAFLHSTDRELDEKHLVVGPTTRGEMRYQILSVAKELWQRMQNSEDREIPMTHDGYLKLWAHCEPEIRGRDIILLDEAQDTNPVALEIVMKQVVSRSAGLILVGDTHQSIYRWRNAIDAMEHASERADYRFSLTESFRFGPGIARDASLLLNHLKSDSVQLTGRAKSGGGLNTFAVLARTNARLLGMAVGKAQEGMSIHFSATTADRQWDPFVPYKFQMTLDIYYLWCNKPHLMRDPYLKKFRSFAEVEVFAKGEGEERHGRDIELGFQVELIKEHQHGIPRLLKLLQQQSCAPEKAKLSFSTVHRAKGREWDAVQLAGDFLNPGDQEMMNNLERSVLIEESNILYVAVTRARKKILYPPELQGWLREVTPAGVDLSHQIKLKCD